MDIRSFTRASDKVRNLHPTAADRRLAFLWGRVADVFPPDRRPEPKWRWAEPNRTDPRTVPWRPQQESMCNAARAAWTLSPAAQHELRERGLAFYRGLEAEFLACLPPADDADIPTLVLEETDAEGPVNAIQTRLVRDQSPATLAVAEEHMDRYHAKFSRLLHRVRHMRRTLGAA